MKDNMVMLILQAVEESKAIVKAIEHDNPEAVIEYEPAMIKISCPGKLVVNAESVETMMGRAWDPQEIQLVLVTLAGNVDEDYDHFTLYWN